MELSQMDIVGGVLLADGTEAKVVTGLDDHSRYCVIATVVRRARQLSGTGLHEQHRRRPPYAAIPQ